MATLKQQLRDTPTVFAKSCLVVDEGDMMLVKEVNQQLGLAYSSHLVLLSAVPREEWTGTQKLCFNTVKGREGMYVDVIGVFPAQRGEQADQPELLPEGPEDILNLAVRMAKEKPVIFWGKSSVYAGYSAWPKDQFITPVAVSLSINAEKFFDDLLEAKSGFYFLEADGERDLCLTRGVDYRNSQPRGISLVLASTFTSKSEYIQALGRVRRGADEGQVWELQEQMWQHD